MFSELYTDCLWTGYEVTAYFSYECNMIQDNRDWSNTLELLLIVEFEHLIFVKQ